MNENRNFWVVSLAAAAVLMITMGARLSLGLFISPLNSSTGLGITKISLALAIGQFAWGAAQPFAGAAADRYGPGRVIAIGTLVLALGCALTPLMSSGFGLCLTLGLLTSAGAGAGAFSVLIGAASRRLPQHQRGMTSGIINAGGSFGQFLFAPLLQALIVALGWMGAMWSLAALTLGTLPLARVLRSPPPEPPKENALAHEAKGGGLAGALRGALRDRSYLLLHAGFFTCGFHVAFLVTHLPGEVQLCGLPVQVASWSLAIIGITNVVGSIAAGWSIQLFRSKSVLAAMYGSRALLIALYLMAPKTSFTFYLFAAGLGLTWLATVPPTASVVGKLFGSRYLATLFGLTMFSHQTGGFLGAWLGGIAVTRFGDYGWMWYADMGLAALAALCNLPIREAPVAPRRGRNAADS